MAVIKIKFNGEEYEGRYAVSKKILTVQSPFGSKSAHTSAVGNESLARLLLSELVSDYLKRK